MPKGIGYKGNRRKQLSELKTEAKPNVDSVGMLSALKKRQKQVTT